MADTTQDKQVTFEELVLNNLALTDALAKLLIAKNVITQEEFNTSLRTQRANYQAVLKRMQ